MRATSLLYKLFTYPVRANYMEKEYKHSLENNIYVSQSHTQHTFTCNEFKTIDMMPKLNAVSLLKTRKPKAQVKPISGSRMMEAFT